MKKIKKEMKKDQEGRSLLSPPALKSLGTIPVQYWLSPGRGGLPSGQEGLTKLPHRYFQEWLQNEKLEHFSSDTLSSPAHSY